MTEPHGRRRREHQHADETAIVILPGFLAVLGTLT